MTIIFSSCLGLEGFLRSQMANMENGKPLFCGLGFYIYTHTVLLTQQLNTK